MELAKKLQVKVPGELQVMNLPADLEPLLTSEGFVVTTSDKPRNALIFCQSIKDIEQAAGQIIPGLDPNGLCWMAYPKKSGQLKTDISRENGWEAMEQVGWLPVRQVSINSDWSTLRFRRRSDIKELRRGQDHPNVDRQQKRVIVPDQVTEALSKEGLTTAYEGLSFSQKKEYIVGIVDAKKEETRAKRLEIMLSFLRTVQG